MNATIYQPPTDIRARFIRHSARRLVRRSVRPQLQRGLVSLSFDDCPRSVFETALPMIEAKGWRATIYASVGLCGTTNHLGLHMSEEDLVCAHEAGHEIGDHTFSHIDLTRIGTKKANLDIERNRDSFRRLNLPSASTFAYPYGAVSPDLKRSLSGQFDLLRGVHTPSGGTIDLNLVASARLYSSEIEATLDHIERAARDKHWLFLFGHDVREDCSDFGCTPEELERVLERINMLGLDVTTAQDGLRRLAA